MQSMEQRQSRNKDECNVSSGDECRGRIKQFQLSQSIQGSQIGSTF